MSAHSRRKGTRGEQEIATAYRQAGYDAARVPNSGGLKDPGDVTGVPGVHVEVKRARERFNIWKALDQTATEAPPGMVPALHFRRDRGGWWIAIPLDDWLELLRTRDL